MKHNWEYKKLGDICQTISGLWTGKNPPFVNVGVIRNTNFTKQCTLNPDNIFYTDVEVKAFAKRKLQKGDIIIEKSGGSEKQPVGRPILFLLDGEFSFSNFTATLRLKDKSISSIFLHKSLTSLYFNGVTRKLQSRTTGLFNLNWKEYLNLRIPVPPMEVQERIVAELDKINEMIEDCRELLRNLDALGQSLFYDYFGDPITNPYNFPKSKLDQLCNIVGRIGFRGYTRNDLVEAGQGAITLSPTNIVNGVVTYDKNTYISWDKYDESPEIMIFDGDVLLTKTGSTVGKIGIVKTLPEKATINPQLVVLKNLKLNNWYITFTLRNDAYQEIIREKSGGSAVPTISQKILGTISLPVPPLELQEKFAERIEQIEAQKEAVESTIAELQTLLDSRMDYWFN